MTLFSSALIVKSVMMAQKKRRRLIVVVVPVVVIRDTPIGSEAAKIGGDCAEHGDSLAMPLSEDKREEAG